MGHYCAYSCIEVIFNYSWIRHLYTNSHIEVVHGWNDTTDNKKTVLSEKSNKQAVLILSDIMFLYLFDIWYYFSYGE